MTIFQLASLLDHFLDSSIIKDGSPNGIQVANRGEITHVATAVTASLEVIKKTVASGAQALIVHHGILKNHETPLLTGIFYEKIRLLIDII